MAEEGEWYHCGRCGHLFRGVAGQRCAECGGNPVVGEREVAMWQAARHAGGGEPPVPHRAASGAAPRRSRKRHGGLRKFVVGWVLFLGLLAGLATFMKKEAAGDAGGQEPVTAAAEDQRVLGEAFRQCTERVRQFLRETTPEQQAKLVHDRGATLRGMVRLGGTGLRLSEDEEWQWQRFSPLEIGGAKAFEGVIVFADGKRAEFAFLPDENGEWNIDWANLVRYSDHPWPLFLSGDTPATGEFRLLARRRAGSDGRRGDATSLVLFAPERWDPKQTAGRSPRIDVAPGSPEARLLELAFEARDAGRGAFGSRLHAEDPAAMVRVRVKLRRGQTEDEGAEPPLEIEELLACHWLSVEDPGFGEEDE